MYILFKIKYTNMTYATIETLQRVSINDKSWYMNFILKHIIDKEEFYTESQIESFLFSYGFLNKK
jgi:hypothetical protein